MLKNQAIQYNVSNKCKRSPHLQDERRSRFELQHGRAEGFKHRVGIETEGLVHHQQRLNVIHDEPDLIRPAARLWETPLGPRHGRHQTHHHRVIEHSAVLWETANIKSTEDTNAASEPEAERRKTAARARARSRRTKGHAGPGGLSQGFIEPFYVLYPVSRWHFKG